MNLQDKFPLIFYTNMDYREDRKQQCIEELTKINVVAERAPGVVWTGTPNKVWNGYIGCGLTHYNCLEIALQRNENVFMFEDDVEFIHNYNEIIPQVLNELPDDWDMLYLGANICGSIFQVSSHIGRLTHAQATHAYGVNKKFIPKMLELDRYSQIVDVAYATKIVPQNNCYVSIPLVATQRDNFSDIEGKQASYTSWMVERFNTHLIRKE